MLPFQCLCANKTTPWFITVYAKFNLPICNLYTKQPTALFNSLIYKQCLSTDAARQKKGAIQDYQIEKSPLWLLFLMVELALIGKALEGVAASYCPKSNNGHKAWCLPEVFSISQRDFLQVKNFYQYRYHFIELNSVYQPTPLNAAPWKSPYGSSTAAQKRSLKCSNRIETQICNYTQDFSCCHFCNLGERLKASGKV